MRWHAVQRGGMRCRGRQARHSAELGLGPMLGYAGEEMVVNSCPRIIYITKTNHCASHCGQPAGSSPQAPRPFLHAPPAHHSL